MKFPYPQKFLIAIVFVKDQNGRQAVYKYQHNIKDNTHYITKFCNDMKRKFPGAEYVNFYNKATNTFKERIYLS